MILRKLSLLTLLFLFMAGMAHAQTKVCGLGDSITEGFQSSPTTDPTLLQAGYLNQFTSSSSYSSFQDGQVGFASGDWVTYTGGSALFNAVANFQGQGCNVIQYMIGTNDAKDATATSPSTYNSNVSSTISTLKAQGFNSIILNYPPYINTNTGGWTASLANPRLLTYQTQMIAIAAADPTHVKIGDNLAYSYFQANPSLQQDGVHPTGSPSNVGYKALAQLWAAGYVRANPLAASNLGNSRWLSIIDPTRATDWSLAGAGVIPARATTCSTPSLASPDTAMNITSISESSHTVTVNVSGALTTHVTVGEYIAIAGTTASSGGYNGTFQIQTTGSSTFTLTNSTSGLAAGGAVGTASATRGAANATTINSAISGCAANDTVLLPSGTFHVAGILHGTSNVTLRGGGANTTFLLSDAASNCNGAFAAGVCIWNSDGNYSGGPDNTANWTAGYSQGTESITLSSHTNLSVGQLLNLDQYNDTYAISAATCTGGIVTATIGTNTFSITNGKPIATIQGVSPAGYNSPATISNFTGGGSYPVTAVTGTTVSYNLSPASCPAAYSSGGTLTLDDGALTVSNDASFSAFPTTQGNNTGRPGNSCSSQAGGFQCRGSTQGVVVTACGTSTFGAACISNTITITPGIRDPHIRADRSPGAWWGTTMPVYGAGLENLSIDDSAVGDNIITLYQCVNCWVRGVRTLFAGSSHVLVIQSVHDTVRDNYFYGNQCHGSTCSQSYGTDMYVGAADNLMENNIFQHDAIPMQNEGGMANVYGYNNAIDDDNHVSPDFPLGTLDTHTAGIVNLLSEGNIGQTFKPDDFHGTGGAFSTIFRTYFRGWEPGRDTQTVPILLETGARNTNILGNVLGSSSLPSVNYTWQWQVNSGADATNCSASILALGFNGLCNDRNLTNNCNYQATPPPPGNCEISDSQLNLPTASPAGTTMYWNNYDTVNAAVRANASEVPSSLPIYWNQPPPTTSLTSSYYGADVTHVNYWQTPWGTPAFPPIGPDVSSGNIPSVGGFANVLPSTLALGHNPVDSNYSVTSTVTAASCTSNTVTLTIGAQAANVDPGTFFSVSGMTPSGYNILQSVIPLPQLSATTGTTISYKVASCPGTATILGSAIAPLVINFNAANSYAAISGAATAPSCTPTSGTVPQTVTCTNPNSGTTDICYTTNGATPATDGTGAGCTTGTKYTTPITISVASTLKVIAGTSTLTDSSVVSYSYTSPAVTLPAPALGPFAMNQDYLDYWRVRGEE